jgi:hypothetical protein
VRFYFAGGESMNKILLDNGVKNTLISYYYLREKGPKTLEKILNGFENVFLDSGAFTFHMMFTKRGYGWEEAYNSQELVDYTKEYGEFLAKYGHRFDIAAEIDVGHWPQKLRQREYLESVAPNTKILPVIHPSDPPEYRHFLCKNYEYVGLGGVGNARSLEAIKSYVVRSMQVARQYGTRYHGFAITTIEIMKALPFFSCDSTSWLMGSKYGMTFYFDGHRLRAYDKFGKKVRKQLKHECIELGLDHDKFVGDVAATVNTFNLLQWKRFSDYLTTRGDGGIGMFKDSQESFFRFDN